MNAQSLRTASRGRKPAPTIRPLRRADLPAVETACLLTAPSGDLLGRRCLSEQLARIDGDRLPPLLVIIRDDITPKERLRLFHAAVTERRRSRAANDTGSSVIYLAGRRWAGGAS